MPPIILRIPVAAAFQAYLVRRRNLTWRIAFAIVLLATLAYFWPHHFKHSKDPTDYWHIFLSLMLYLFWREQRRWTWHYDFGLKDAKLISLGRWEWEWGRLKWPKNPYVDIKRQIWNGLPMLVITRRTAYFWEPKRLLLVYSPEDEALVEQIIPYMAKRGTLVSEGAWYQKA
ncbi:MAG TPA: hypothetical protein VFW40_01390 [Capsulimonadaceae bacterium]|nr:hypothetical protein [Capsulimonadaceae bacterium]